MSELETMLLQTVNTFRRAGLGNSTNFGLQLEAFKLAEDAIALADAKHGNGYATSNGITGNHVSNEIVPATETATLTYKLKASTGYECSGSQDGISPEQWGRICASIASSAPPTQPAGEAVGRMQDALEIISEWSDDERAKHLAQAALGNSECPSCNGFDGGCEECSGLGKRGELEALRKIAQAARLTAHRLGLPSGFDITKLPDVITAPPAQEFDAWYADNAKELFALGPDRVARRAWQAKGNPVIAQPVAWKWLHGAISGLPVHQHKMTGTGQTHSFLVRDDVLGWIEEGERRAALSAPPAQVPDMDSVMSKVQEFASAWALVGGKFDDGSMLDEAESRKSELRAMLASAPQPRIGELTRATQDVLAERRRQVESEGWTSDHDDEHAPCMLATAGACYAIFWMNESSSPLPIWPWDKSWWKPSEDPRRNWIKATALMLAEVERYDRASPQPKEGE